MRSFQRNEKVLDKKRSFKYHIERWSVVFLTIIGFLSYFSPVTSSGYYHRWMVLLGQASFCNSANPFNPTITNSTMERHKNRNLIQWLTNITDVNSKQILCHNWCGEFSGFSSETTGVWFLLWITRAYLQIHSSHPTSKSNSKQIIYLYITT